MPTNNLWSALYLDRDGVVIENRSDYVKSLAEIRFIPGALEALGAFAARMAQAGREFRVVIVTNQSAIGRGLVTAPQVDAINQYVVDHIAAAGGRVDGVYVCPHMPQAGCACRKPAPGMLLEAAAALNIHLPRSVMIGDAVSDIQAGRAAGAQTILVRTGRGARQEELWRAAGGGPLNVADDLPAALLALPDSFTKTPP